MNFHYFSDLIIFQNFSRLGKHHFKIPSLFHAFHDRANTGNIVGDEGVKRLYNILHEGFACLSRA